MVAALLPVLPPLDGVLRDLPWRRQVGPSGKVFAAGFSRDGRLHKLSVHRSTADRWIKMAGGDWARYAARRVAVGTGSRDSAR